MSDLKRFILSQLQKGSITKEEAAKYIGELQQKKEKDFNDIAVIGVSCRMPMADNVDEFWDNIINGRNCFTAKPPEKLLLGKPLANPYYAEFLGLSPYEDAAENLEMYIGAYIKDIDKFDANFFGIPPREARFIDPGQRVFLEEAWKSLEDAGYNADNLKGSRTGVFVGKDNSNSIFYKYIIEPDPMSTTGNWEGILASRISYLFNFHGPAMVVDTACSAGLVAVHEACIALKNNECDMCLAGGIAIGAGSVTTQIDEDDNMTSVDTGSMLDNVRSSDNKVRTFDKKCSGTVFGEGVVVLTLKRMDDAIKDGDNIYAVIKGSAINNDGASNGITAPNPAAQEAVIVEAWKNARIDPINVSYVETHGTGTLLGDPIEVIGLTNAFSHYTSKRQFCGIGSVKTNIGHTVAASGVASLLKVVLAMKNGMIPPSVYFQEPNPNINFINSPLYVVDKPTTWSDSENGLLAGVNAFGFSGTNCHVVVEQYKKNIERTNSVDEVITISGKTETSVMEIANSYLNFLRKNPESDIHRLAYTTVLGRGHYEYRIAFCCNTIDELVNQLEEIVKNGFQTCEEKKIYCGINRIVSDRRQHIEPGDITESEYYTITETALKLIEMFTKGNVDTTKYIDLCQLYIRGANIKWSELYTGQKITKMSLPTYAFEKTRYWGDLRQTKIERYDLEKKDSNYPYLVRCIADSMNQKIYLLRFSVEKDWVLQEHKIFSTNIVPGTAYLEVCLEVFKEIFDSNSITIENIMFFDALAITEDMGLVDVHFTITMIGEDGANFIVASRRPDDKGDYIWTQHAQGKVLRSAAPAKKQPILNEVLKNGNVTEVNMELPEDGQNSDTAVYLGPRWKSFDNIYKLESENEECIYVEMNLQDKYEDDIKHFLYHPSMADAALNFPLQLYVGHDVYLPYSYKNLKIYGKLPKQFYSRVKKISGHTGSDVMVFNAAFIDTEGNVVADIEEYAVKKVNRFNDYTAVKFHHITWEVRSETETKDVFKVPAGIAIFFDDEEGMSQKLAEEIKNDAVVSYHITFGSEYQKIDNTHYMITGASDEYEQLIQDIGVDKITSIFHMSTYTSGNFVADLEHSANPLNKGLYSLLFLSKAMLKKVNHEVEFYLIADYVHDVKSKEIVNPFNTSYMALAKTLQYECPKYHFNCFDMDSSSCDVNVMMSQLKRGFNQFRVAFRDNVMYSEILEEVDLSKQEEVSLEGKKEGIYVITGGTGGLGLEAAHYLSWFGCKNICLLGRLELPEREKWDSVLMANENIKVCRMIKRIQEIEDEGNHVIVKNADIADFEAMSLIFKNLKSEYGNINGIIHSAGIAGDGILLNKSFEVFNKVVSPKIIGTLIIHELTKDQKLDFFIMYSSMQTLFGGIGQGDYTAANAFMDGFSKYLRLQNVKAQTINWPGWSETGMAVDYKVADDVTLFTSVNNSQGVKGLHGFMTHNVTNLVPGDINYKFLASIQPENLPFDISTQIKRIYDRYIKKMNTTGSSAEKINGRETKFNAEEFAILGKEESEYTATEYAVAFIYASVLDLQEIDIYESFNSLGGDSIMATEVFKVLDQNFPGILNISDVFSYPTVEEMSSHIHSIMDNSKNKVRNDENYTDMLGKLDSGEIEVDSMIKFFENQDK